MKAYSIVYTNLRIFVQFPVSHNRDETRRVCTNV